MPFDFPTSPAVGTVSGNYTWDGEKWITAGGGADVALRTELQEQDRLVGSAVPLTSAVNAEICKVTLQPGEWELWGNIVLAPGGGTTVSKILAFITTVLPPAEPAGSNFGASVLMNYSSSASNDITLAGSRFITVTVPTVVYLSARVHFAVSTMGVYGYLGARRRYVTGGLTTAVQKKNYIINGAMQISQENPLIAVTANAAYPVDQWMLGFINGGTQTAQQVASLTPAGSPNRLRVTATVADAAVAATDYLYVRQGIEGLRIADLRSGLASAKTITIQFGVKAPAGTYSVNLYNTTAARCYVAEYTIAAGEANTDVVKSVTITLDQTGTWATDNTAGLFVGWTLMCGTTYQQAAGSWVAATKFGSPNQFNFMGTAGNVFELFDVSVTEGTTAPAFVVPDYPTELAACQRYYYTTYEPGVVPGTITNVGAEQINITMSTAIAGAHGRSLNWKVKMRAAPVVVSYSSATGAINKIRDQANGTEATPILLDPSTNGIRFWGGTSTAATAGPNFIGHVTANARL